VSAPPLAVEGVKSCTTILLSAPSDVSIRQHTSAYVSIRERVAHALA
jgi:hypothetical protein